MERHFTREMKKRTIPLIVFQHFYWFHSKGRETVFDIFFGLFLLLDTYLQLGQAFIV